MLQTANALMVGNPLRCFLKLQVNVKKEDLEQLPENKKKPPIIE
jgi:hypothetical protein